MSRGNFGSIFRRIGAVPQSIRRRFGRSQLATGAPEASADDRRLVFSLSRARIPNGQQMRFLGDVLSRRERGALQWFGFLAIVALLILIGSFFARHIQAAPRPGGTLTEGLVGIPEYINPVLARPNTLEAELTGLTFRGLMHMDQNFHLTPDLAEKVDVSPDGKAYTITLRRNLHWSDGSAITARDVEYTFTTLADPAYKSPLLSLFRNVKVVRKDDRTVVFTLPEPLAPFLSYLTVGILPEAAWIDSTPQTFPLSELNLRPISNGPFAFQSLTKDRDGTMRSLEFIRNEHANGPRPYLEKVVVKLYPDHIAALDALHTHAIDALGGVEPLELSGAQSGRAMTPFDISQLTAVFLNQRSNGALKAKEVRLALAYATDRPTLVKKALENHGRPIIGPILPGYLGYNPELLRYDFDLTHANQVLEDAGWKQTDSGVRQKGSQQLTFTFHVADLPSQVAVAEQLVANWKKIGANVELKKVDVTRIQRDVIRPRSYEALLFGQIFNTDPDPYPFWHSSQQRELGFNLSIFFNRKIDQDLEDGRTTTNNTQRATDYFDFQNNLAEEIPAIFLYQHQYLYVHIKGLRGIATKRLVSGVDRFQNIETWYLKTWPKWVGRKSD